MQHLVDKSADEKCFSLATIWILHDVVGRMQNEPPCAKSFSELLLQFDMKLKQVSHCQKGFVVSGVMLARHLHACNDTLAS